MKRLISLLLAALLLGCAVATGEITGELADVPVPEAGMDYSELVIANPTPMDGKFFTGCWGNATTDIDVRSIVHSYYLTVWGPDTGLFSKNNTVVSGLVMTDNEEGDRTYTFALYDDLYFSDGSRITAWDYAFSVLFQGSPLIAELGGVPLDLSYLEGYEEYYSGEAKALAGVRVINDDIIRFTVKHEYLPYFFELYRLGFLPYPIQEIAPGCKVFDDGEGVYIGNAAPGVDREIFSKELLEATVMDPSFGYLSYPTVGCGPYILTGWDGKEATFRINPYYKGNEEGNVPSIPNLRFTLGDNADMIEKLGEDELQLLNKVTLKESIDKGLELTASGDFSMTSYPRIGLTFFMFTPDRPAVQEANVRRAIAYCLDKEPMIRDYPGTDYGLPMDGMMGIGQWMFGLVGTAESRYEEIVYGALEDPSPEEQKELENTIGEWKSLNFDGLTRYSLDVEKAIRLLEENGWILNEKGEPYDPDRDAFRCKEIGGEMVKLDLTCAYPDSNHTGTVSMDEYFISHLQEAGIRLTLVPMTMKDLLKAYNDRDAEDIDIFYLGDDFNIEFDPQLFFLPGDPEEPEEDTLAWVHAQMYEYCRLMCETEPRDLLGFMQKWITMQEKLTEYLPLIPVYSNVYFDFYTSELQNYEVLKNITWGDAIVSAVYAPVPEKPEPEGTEQLSEEDFPEDEAVEATPIPGI